MLLPAVAAAQDGGGGLGDGYDVGPVDDPPPIDRELVDDSATFHLSYRDDLEVVTSRGGREGRQAQCGFFDVVAAEGEFIGNFDLVPVEPYERDAEFLLHCWEPGGSPWFDEIPPYPVGFECCGPGVPGDTLVDDWEVAAFAAGSIGFSLPTVETSPAAEQVVGIPTWLAVTSPLDFAPVTAAAGPIWATATPQFREAVWEFGNGDRVTCVDDVALTWDPELDPDAQDSACTYVFSSNGDGAPFAGQATVTWDIFFESSENGGVAEYWGAISQTSPIVFDVRELQAVID